MREADLLDSEHLVTVRELIIEWFNRNGRKFPWRSTKNPYHILIAEMLLRRTTATAVARVYHTFIARFDSLKKLKRARVSTVENIIATLGLQSIRAKHLQKTAALLIMEYSEQIPKDAKVLESLPGVGRYTAAAVSNFGFDNPVSMVDGNVLHLMSRVFALGIESPMDERIWQFMDRLGGDDQDRRLYWGIIDIVAMICLRKNPRCQICPLSQNCEYEPLTPNDISEKNVKGASLLKE